MDDPVLGLEINILSARYLPKVKGDTSGENLKGPPQKFILGTEF